MTITTAEAIALRAKLEADIMRLLEEYQRVTELQPTRIIVGMASFETGNLGRRHIITGVTVTVEV